MKSPLDSLAVRAGPTWIHAAIAFWSLLLFVIVRRRYFSGISFVPGPFLASFSRLWHFKQIYSGKQNVRFTEQHDKYGHFVRVAHNEVSVSHPNAIKALLSTTLPKGEWYKVGCFPDYRFITPFSLLNPRDKNECTKYLSGAYLQHNVLRSEAAIDDNVLKFFGWVKKFSEESKSMDLARFFTYVAFDVTGDVIFSRPFGFMETGEDVNGAAAMNGILQIYIAFLGHLQWIHILFANPLVTWLGIFPMGHLFNTTMSALRERQKNPDARADLVSHWFRGLERAKKDNSRLFSQQCLESFATENIGAGSDTVSTGLQSFVYHLLRLPGGWERIRDEIRSAQKQGRCQDEIISYADAAQLPYLQACIKEGLRVFAPVPAPLPRVAPKGGVTIGDTHFPEGVTLTVNPWVIHNSKEIWGEDAREFVPDRWMRPDVAEKEKYFIPWGVGYASCPGQHVARLQLSKIAATLVRDYDIRQVDPEQEWKWSAWFTCVPHDWPVYVKQVER